MSQSQHSQEKNGLDRVTIKWTITGVTQRTEGISHGSDLRKRAIMNGPRTPVHHSHIQTPFEGIWVRRYCTVAVYMRLWLMDSHLDS